MSSPVQNKAIQEDKNSLYNVYDINKLPDAFPKDIFQAQIKSVACLTLEKNIEKGDLPDQLKLSAKPLSKYIRERYQEKYGDQEPYRKEKVLGFGTAFLVGRRHAVTAAHCVCSRNSNVVDEKQVKKTRLVFDYHLAKKGDQENPSTIKEDAVYSIKHVVLHHYSRGEKWEDWALLELDRDVKDRPPLELDCLNPLEKEIEQTTEGKQNLYMIGHPTGLTLKLTLGGKIEELHPNRFRSGIDAFSGNSGSPVLSLITNKVVGILCEGATDFEKKGNYRNSTETRIQLYVVNPEEKTKGSELCQRISQLDFIPYYCHIHSKLSEPRQKQFNIKEIENKEMAEEQFFKNCQGPKDDVGQYILKTLKPSSRSPINYHVSVKNIWIERDWIVEFGLFPLESSLTPEQIKLRSGKIKAREIVLYPSLLQDIIADVKDYLFNTGSPNRTYHQLYTVYRSFCSSRNEEVISPVNENKIVDFFRYIDAEENRQDITRSYMQGIAITLRVGNLREPAHKINFIECELTEKGMAARIYRFLYDARNGTCRMFGSWAPSGTLYPLLDQIEQISNLAYQLQSLNAAWLKYNISNDEYQFMINIKPTHENPNIRPFERGTLMHHAARVEHLMQMHLAKEKKFIFDIEKMSEESGVKEDLQKFFPEGISWAKIAMKEAHYMKWASLFISKLARHQTNEIRKLSNSAIGFNYTMPLTKVILEPDPNLSNSTQIMIQEMIKKTLAAAELFASTTSRRK